MNEKCLVVFVPEKMRTSTTKHRGEHAKWKKWTTQQELIRLFQKKTSIETLAERYHGSPHAITMKLKRLWLGLAAHKIEVTGPFEIPEELPSLPISLNHARSHL